MLPAAPAALDLDLILNGEHLRLVVYPGINERDADISLRELRNRADLIHPISAEAVAVYGNALVVHGYPFVPVKRKIDKLMTELVLEARHEDGCLIAVS